MVTSLRSNATGKEKLYQFVGAFGIVTEVYDSSPDNVVAVRFRKPLNVSLRLETASLQEMEGEEEDD